MNKLQQVAITMFGAGVPTMVAGILFHVGWAAIVGAVMVLPMCIWTMDVYAKDVKYLHKYNQTGGMRRRR